MILIVTSSSATATRIRAALPGGVISQSVLEWHEACHAALRAGCIVIELGLPDEAMFAHKVQLLRATAPGIAVVAVAPLHASAVRCAIRAGVDDFVALEALEAEGWQVIREARTRTLRQQVIGIVRSAIRLNDAFREAMVVAIDADSLPRTSAALGQLTRSSRTSLYRWAARGALPEDGGRVVREALDWIALTHCISKKRRDVSWDAVAREVGVDVRTLRAIARRRTGVALAELDEPGHARFLGACRTWCQATSGGDPFATFGNDPLR